METHPISHDCIIKRTCVNTIYSAADFPNLYLAYTHLALAYTYLAVNNYTNIT